MQNKSIKILRYLFWLLSLSTMVLIFYFSSENSLESSSSSGDLIKNVLNFLSDSFRNLSEIGKLSVIKQYQHIVRKGAHFSIYAFLGFSLLSAMFTYKIKTYKKFLASLMIALLYAISDEIHQIYVPGRAGTLSDVIIDFSGALTGAFITWLIIIVYLNIKNRGDNNMKKKELLMKIFDLASTVDKFNARIKDLEKENETLKIALESAVNGPKNEISFEELPPVTEEPEEMIPQGFSVKSIEEVDFEANTTEPTITYEKCEVREPTLNDEAMEYGAAVIGKITVESAKFCDIVTSKNLPNVKELLGLIMGKSELSKSDILGISQSDISYDNKVAMMDSQLNEAVEYFKSISEQN